MKNKQNVKYRLSSENEQILLTLAEYKREINSLLEMNEDLQEKKQEAEDFSKRKSEFLANMSHELRTPMHAILSFSKMSLKKLGVIEKNRLMNNLQIIHENGQRLLHTLNEILDISKLEADRMDFNYEENDVKVIVLAIIRELQSLLLDKGITYSVNAENVDSTAEFDSYRIGQVIQNILSNAIKFTPTKGKININISNTTLSGSPAVKVSISDEGFGIPTHELDIIFDKYVQSSKRALSAKGTGLGLSISRKIISHHKGRIWAENNRDSGSTFHFIIPKKQEE